MARPRKEGVKVSYILDKEVAESLDKFWKSTGGTKTGIVELAIQEFLERHQKEKNKEY